MPKKRMRFTRRVRRARVDEAEPQENGKNKETTENEENDRETEEDLAATRHRADKAFGFEDPEIGASPCSAAPAPDLGIETRPDSVPEDSIAGRAVPPADEAFGFENLGRVASMPEARPSGPDPMHLPPKAAGCSAARCEDPIWATRVWSHMNHFLVTCDAEQQRFYYAQVRNAGTNATVFWRDGAPFIATPLPFGAAIIWQSAGRLYALPLTETSCCDPDVLLLLRRLIHFAPPAQPLSFLN